MKNDLAGAACLCRCVSSSSCTIKTINGPIRWKRRKKARFPVSIIVPEYARGFELSYRSGYVLLDIQDPQNEESTTFHYALVRRGTKRPASLDRIL